MGGVSWFGEVWSVSASLSVFFLVIILSFFSLNGRAERGWVGGLTVIVIQQLFQLVFALGSGAAF